MIISVEVDVVLLTVAIIGGPLGLMMGFRFED